MKRVELLGNREEKGGEGGGDGFGGVVDGENVVGEGWGGDIKRCEEG